MFLGLGELVDVGTQARSESALVFNDNILVRHTGTRVTYNYRRPPLTRSDISWVTNRKGDISGVYTIFEFSTEHLDRFQVPCKPLFWPQFTLCKLLTDTKTHQVLAEMSVMSYHNRTCDVKATKGVGNHCLAVNEDETIPLCEDALRDELLKMDCLSFV